MPETPDEPASRNRAPDSAADLGLYAAPLAVGVPVLLAAADASPLRAAEAPAPGTGAAPPADGAAKAPAPAFGWWSEDEGAGNGVSAKVGPAAASAAPAADAKAEAGEDGGGKVVLLHAGASAPPASAPLSNLEPVARADAGEPPAAPIAVADEIAPIADASGQTAINLVGQLADGLAAPAGAAAAAVGIAGGTLAGATGLVAETLDGASGLLAELAPLGGADPLGGIATLVDMVATSDLLGLGDLTAPVDGLLVSVGGAAEDLGTDSLPIADIAAAPAEVLLGLGDPEPGALGLLGLLADDTI